MKRVRCAWPCRVPVGQRDLHRGVGGFRAGVAEEHVVEIGRRQRRDPAGQLEGARMAELEGRREVELGRLLLDRLDDRVAVVAGVGAPQARGAVEDRAALRRVVVHVLGARDQPRPRLEGAIGGERHEEGFEVVRHRRGEGAFLRLSHGPPRCLDRTEGLSAFADNDKRGGGCYHPAIRADLISSAWPTNPTS